MKKKPTGGSFITFSKNPSKSDFEKDLYAFKEAAKTYTSTSTVTTASARTALGKTGIYNATGKLLPKYK